MYLFNVLNNEIYLENYNKLIIFDYNNYFNFLNNIIHFKNVTLNGMPLTDKNSIILDFTNYTSIINYINSENYLKDYYIELKLKNYYNFDKNQDKIYNIIKTTLKDNYNDLCNLDFEINLNKILKTYINLNIKELNDLFKIIDYIIRNTNKQVIFIFSNSIIRKLDITYMQNKIKKYNNVINIEICDKYSKLNDNDNLIFIQEIITQITGNSLFNIINTEYKLKYGKEANLSKLLLYSFNKSEVDAMSENIEEINNIANICNERLNLLNLTDLDI